MNDRAELRQLLAGEIAARLSVLRNRNAAIQDVRAAIHSLKGSAAMAGESELALIVGQLGQRMRDGERRAREITLDVLLEASHRLSSGESAFETTWPEPPPHLLPSRIDPEYREEYVASMRDRIESLGEFGDTEANQASVQRAYRLVHGMKGAAASVGDDVTAWFCHGLENRLKLGDVASVASRWREFVDSIPTLRLLLEEPSSAVTLLRAAKGAKDRKLPVRSPSTLPPHPRPSSAWPPTNEEPGELLRVPSSTLEKFLEHAERIELVRYELATFGADVARNGVDLRELRMRLFEALRILTPAEASPSSDEALRLVEDVAESLGKLSESILDSTLVCRKNLDHLLFSATEIHARATALQRTTVSWLFERVRLGIEQLAAAQGREVVVELHGGDLYASRKVIERLHDPVMQLARNALAHGIRSPERRVARGKNPHGSIVLSATRVGDWLQVTVEDDGEGVDLPMVKKLAVSRGILRERTAQFATESDLLGLLFLPGMTTRRESDLLAGRGIGLDLAHDGVRRLGGSIRLGHRMPDGVTATIRVPAERGLVDVLWLVAAGQEFAVPVSFTGTVIRSSAPCQAPALSEVLGQRSVAPCAYELTIEIPGVQGVNVGIEEVRGTQRTNIRPVPPTVAAAGPYTGAILRPDGSLRPVLDAALLAAQLWTRGVGRDRYDDIHDR